MPDKKKKTDVACLSVCVSFALQFFFFPSLEDFFVSIFCSQIVEWFFCKHAVHIGKRVTLNGLVFCNCLCGNVGLNTTPDYVFVVLQFTYELSVLGW